jgi:hypothetical protein
MFREDRSEEPLLVSGGWREWWREWDWISWEIWDKEVIN